MPDGKVVIETALETKNFDKQIENTNSKLKKLEKLYDAALKAKGKSKESEEIIQQLGADIENLNNKLVDLYSKREKLIQQQLPKEFIPDVKTEIESEEIQKLISKLNVLKNAYDNINKQDIWSDDDVDKLDKIEIKIKETIKSLEKMTGKKWQILGFEEIEKQSKKNNKSIDIGINKLKRFALSLVSVSSIFAVVSKASSAYLSQNEELANKLQSVWVGLGSFMEPVLTIISDVLLKALGYLNVFVKALTGVDYIAKANAKALEKQAKSQQKLNKATQQYDFDVIRTQQDTTSSSTTSSSLPSGYIDIPELDDKLVTKLQNLAKWLKENERLIKAVGTALGITFGAVAVAKILKNIAKIIGVAGAGTGLAGLGKSLLAIAAVFTVILAVKGALEVKKQIDELNKSLDKNTEAVKYNKEKQDEISKSFWKLYEEGKLTVKQKETMINYTDKQTKSIITQIQELEKQKTWFGEVSDSNRRLNEQQQILLERLDKTNEDYKKLYDQGLLTDEQKSTYIDSLKTEIEELGKLGIKNDDLITQYENLTGKPYTIEVNAKDNTKNVIDIIKNRLRSALGGGVLAFGTSGGGGFRGFAAGGIITQPTRALIGEAGYPEAVVPMTSDYLSTLANEISKYSGSGSGITNVYLNGRLIQREISKTQDRLNFATNK